jgi:hypothetical protein
VSDSPENNPVPNKASPKRENLPLNLVCNIVAPTVILMKFSSDRWLGALWGLVIALAFPIGYGAWDFARRRHANVISMVGFASVLLSGGLGLLRLDGFWFAVKDAAMPAVIGVAVLVSARSRRPLVNQLVYNDQVIDTARVDAALDARGNRGAFMRLLRRASWWLAGTFLVSAVLNFFLARYLIRGTPGTEEFNAGLGKMHFWNLPVIVLPSMVMLVAILWRLVSGVQRLSGLEQEAIFRGGEKN